MSDLIATKTQGKLIPEGVHVAVCFGIYDLGTQYSKVFDNEAHKVLFQWEVPDSRIEISGEDLPMVISKKYTLTLNKKSNLKKDLDSWLGQVKDKSFGLKQLLGKNCQILISHADKDGITYANITAIMALPQEMKPLISENPLRFYSLEDGANFPEGASEWIIKIIKESREYKDKIYSQEKSTEEESEEESLEEEFPEEESEETLQDLKKTFDEEGIVQIKVHPKKKEKKINNPLFH